MSEGESVSDFNCCGLKTGEAGSTGLTGRLDSRPVGPVRADANSSFGNICPNFCELKLYYLGTETKKFNHS